MMTATLGSYFKNRKALEIYLLFLFTFKCEFK